MATMLEIMVDTAMSSVLRRFKKDEVAAFLLGRVVRLMRETGHDLEEVIATMREVDAEQRKESDK